MAMCLRVSSELFVIGKRKFTTIGGVRVAKLEVKSILSWVGKHYPGMTELNSLWFELSSCGVYYVCEYSP